MKVFILNGYCLGFRLKIVDCICFVIESKCYGDGVCKGVFGCVQFFVVVQCLGDGGLSCGVNEKCGYNEFNFVCLMYWFFLKFCGFREFSRKERGVVDWGSGFQVVDCLLVV